MAVIGILIRSRSPRRPLGDTPHDGGVYGRKRPCTIGDSADVETAQSMYPYISSHHAQTEGGDHGPRVASRPLVTPQHHGEVRAYFLLPVLKCSGVVQRQPGWPMP